MVHYVHCKVLKFSLNTCGRISSWENHHIPHYHSNTMPISFQYHSNIIPIITPILSQLRPRSPLCDFGEWPMTGASLQPVSTGCGSHEMAVIEVFCMASYNTYVYIINFTGIIYIYIYTHYIYIYLYII